MGSFLYLFLRSCSGLDSLPGNFGGRPQVDDQIDAEVNLGTRGQELEPLAEDTVGGLGQLVAAVQVLHEAEPRAVEASLHHLK